MTSGSMTGARRMDIGDSPDVLAGRATRRPDDYRSSVRPEPGAGKVRGTFARRFLAPPRGELFLGVASALGWGIGVAAVVVMATWTTMGSDAEAYWLATRHLLEGGALYERSNVAADGAYFYPPLFAQLWAPLAFLPREVFVWAFRLAGFLSLRYLAGSWRNVGLWMLIPLTVGELSRANVTFPVAAMSLAALRGRGWLAPWAGALKFGPFLLIPYLWFRGDRRHVITGCVSLGLAGLLSVALSPGAWAEYAGAMTSLSGSNGGHADLIQIIPSVGMDFALRFGVGFVLVLLAAFRGWPTIAYGVSVLAVPTLWTSRLVPLLALPRLVPRYRWR